jgi:DNA-binding XRE family transcriptional regulator
MKLTATSKHRLIPPQEVIAITRDGWVCTKEGALGDNGVDCNIALEGEREFVRSIMKRLNLTQEELGWVLGISRPTALALAHGRRGLSLKEYMMLKVLVDNVERLTELDEHENPQRDV